VFPQPGHSESAWAAAFSPDGDGKRIVSGSGDNTVKVWAKLDP
jgi:WD40 repeat protein